MKYKEGSFLSKVNIKIKVKGCFGKISLYTNRLISFIKIMNQCQTTTGNPETLNGFFVNVRNPSIAFIHYLAQEIRTHDLWSNERSPNI